MDKPNKKWKSYLLVLDGADRVFVPDPDKEKERMRKKINKLNQHIGELTVELKKQNSSYNEAKTSTKYIGCPINRIKGIKGEHPLWGYRRIWAYMRYRDEILIGKNRVNR